MSPPSTIHPDIVIIIATCPNDEEATSIARKLVEARYAACVQLNPVRSIFRWQGKIDEETEVRLLIKTTANRFDDVATLIRSNTTYQCPEIICCPITAGTRDYFDWIVAETTEDESPH